MAEIGVETELVDFALYTTKIGARELYRWSAGGQRREYAGWQKSVGWVPSVDPGKTLLRLSPSIPVRVAEEEPSLLGAVVEDAGGERWVSIGNGAWLNVDGDRLSWSELKFPIVLDRGRVRP